MTWSIPGLVLSLAVLAPALLLLAWRPTSVPDAVDDGGSVWGAIEKAGQAGCLVAPFLTGMAGGASIAAGVRFAALGVTVAAVGVYYALWVRYLRGRRFVDLYRPWGPVPVPMAVFPVIAFGVSAVWLQSWWVAAAALVLAIGHIGCAWRIWSSIR